MSTPLFDLVSKNGISGVQLENRQTGILTIPSDAKQQILHLHMTLPFFRGLVKKEEMVLCTEFQKK